MASADALLSLRHAVRRVARVWADANRERASARRADVTRLSTRVLARGASVHVIRWNGEELLLGCTDRSIVVLSRRLVDVAREDAA